MQITELQKLLHELFKEVFSRMGLSDWKISEYSLSSGFNPSIMVSFYKTFEVDHSMMNGGQSRLIDQLVNPVRESMENSPWVKDALSDMQIKLDASEAKVKKLEEYLKMLQKYKDHFELEMKLKHGKES